MRFFVMHILALFLIFGMCATEVEAQAAADGAPATSPAPGIETRLIDLTSLVQNLERGQTVKLRPGDYTMVGPYTPPPNVTIDGTGCTLQCRPRDGKSTTSIFSVHNIGFTLKGWSKITGVGVLVTASAPNCTVTGNTIVLMDRAANTNAGAANFTFSCNKIIKTNSMGVYLTSDGFSVTDNDFGHSVGESNLRVGPKTDAKGNPLRRPNGEYDRPVGGVISGNTCLSRNRYRKSAVSIRSGDSIVISGNTISVMRIGQLVTAEAPSYPPGSACLDISVESNTFTNPDVGVNPILIELGCNVTVKGNMFAATIPPDQPPIAVGTTSTVTTSRNVQVRPSATSTLKPLVAKSCAARARSDGSDKIVSAETPIEPPITHPPMPPATQSSK